MDIARGRLVEEIPTYGTAPGDVSGLTRSPSGWLGYAKSRDGRAISVLDLSNFRQGTQVPARSLRKGTKLYLALEGTHQVAVIDRQKRQTHENDLRRAFP